MLIVVLFGHLPDRFYGTADIGEKRAVIKIDLKKNTNPVITYIHELVHIKHPDWPEKKVVQATRKFWNNASQKERFQVYHELFDRVYIPINEYEE